MDQTIFNHPYKISDLDGMFKVSGEHELFWQIIGNKNGIPIVFLHGGPGAKSMSIHHNYFDSKVWKAVLYDQRGCGRSKPSVKIENNNTHLLVEDLENLRRYFNIDKWILFGGSWGSTLALCYGLKYPENCLGFLLRGVFLGTNAEVNWFLKGMGKFFPEAHEKFLKAFDISLTKDISSSEILQIAYEKLFNENPKIHQPAAEAWASYEMSCATLEYEGRNIKGDFALSLARIEAHYFKNNCFLGEDEIISNINLLEDIPMFIVQGRHDVICPPFSAKVLNKKLPLSELIIIENAGHSAFEKGIQKAIFNGLDFFKSKFGK